MKKRPIFYMILFLFNLVSVYFIINLFSYDELVKYVLNEGRITECPRKLAYLLLLCSFANLYFQFFIWMEYLFKDKI